MQERTYTFKQENGKDVPMTFNQEYGVDLKSDVIEFLVQRILKLEEVRNLKN